MARQSLEARGRRIRRTVSKLTTGPQRRYPRALRVQIGEVARARLAGGSSRAAICGELGISAPTLDRVLEESVRLRRVRVSEVAAESVEPPALGIVVRCPGGLVVEGLDPTGVAALVKALV